MYFSVSYSILPVDLEGVKLSKVSNSFSGQNKQSWNHDILGGQIVYRYMHIPTNKTMEMQVCISCPSELPMT